MEQLFTFTINPLELFVRGSVMYVGLVLVFRFILRRDVGSMNMPDLLFIVLVADASQNALAGEYRSLPEGIMLVGTLVAWNVALDWLSFRFPSFHRFISPRPLPLVFRGKWVRQNLKKEWITKEEVESKLREAGIEDIGAVELAVLEASGELGIIRRDSQPLDKKPKNPALKA